MGVVLVCLTHAGRHTAVDWAAVQQGTEWCSTAHQRVQHCTAQHESAISMAAIAAPHTCTTAQAQHSSASRPPTHPPHVLTRYLQDYVGGEFSLFFANCEPDSAVDFKVDVALYNVRGACPPSLSALSCILSCVLAFFVLVPAPQPRSQAEAARTGRPGAAAGGRPGPPLAAQQLGVRSSCACGWLTLLPCPALPCRRPH